MDEMFCGEVPRRDIDFCADDGSRLICCICGTLVSGMGHNPAPLNYNREDRCCDKCNTETVILARLVLSLHRMAGRE